MLENFGCSMGGSQAVELLAAGHTEELLTLDNPLVTSVATGLAHILQELGHLPDHEAATKALEERKRFRHFLSRRREVA